MATSFIGGENQQPVTSLNGLVQGFLFIETDISWKIDLRQYSVFFLGTHETSIKLTPHDITKILLKVVLNTKTSNLRKIQMCFILIYLPKSF